MQDGTADSHPTFAGERVLLVEDNEINRRVISRMLGKMGLVVAIAVDGGAAVNLYEPGRFDLVLMDVQMPVMDGIGATREIRRLYPEPHVPIMALTANALGTDRVRCLASGMDDYLAKPVTLEVLRDAIARWLVRAPS